MTADTPAAAPTAEREAFEQWALKTHGRFALVDEYAGAAWDAWQGRAALSAPVAAPPVDPLLGQALQALVRYANAFDADAKTVAVIQALEERIDAAPPAASGVDALWVETAMKLAADCALNVDSFRYWEARAALRTHLSTALTGETK